MSVARIQVTQTNGHWWFVSPEGTPFVSIGVNHLQSDCWLAPQNLRFMQERYGEDLVDAEGKFDPAGTALPRLVSSLTRRLHDLGFNTLGIHTYDVPPSLFADDFFYCVAIEYFPLGSRYKFNAQTFPDIFASDFEEGLEAHIRTVTHQHREHTSLIGYAFSDIPRWYFYEGQKRDSQPVHPWVRDLMSQPPGTPGRDHLQQVLGTSTPTRREESDRALEAMVEKWVALHHRLLRKHDPNRLLLGDKLHSPHRIPRWMEPILARYLDVLLIQWYTPPGIQEPVLRGLHQRTGLPILNGDSSFGCAQPPHQTVVKGCKVNSKAEAGQAYAHYLTRIMRWPFMLGWHHCGIVEQWDGAKKNDWEINENGFFTPFEEPYPEMVNPIREANLRAKAIHRTAGNS
jgi:hypothetical protein